MVCWCHIHPNRGVPATSPHHVVVLHLGAECSISWACSKDKIFQTLLALSEKMSQTSPKRLSPALPQPCRTKREWPFPRTGGCDSAPLSPPGLGRAPACPRRVPSVHFAFLMSLSLSFLSKHAGGSGFAAAQ